MKGLGIEPKEEEYKVEIICVSHLYYKLAQKEKRTIEWNRRFSGNEDTRTWVHRYYEGRDGKNIKLGYNERGRERKRGGIQRDRELG